MIDYRKLAMDAKNLAKCDGNYPYKLFTMIIPLADAILELVEKDNLVGTGFTTSDIRAIADLQEENAKLKEQLSDCAALHKGSQEQRREIIRLKSALEAFYGLHPEMKEEDNTSKDSKTKI